jgi:subtilase family serine protease
MKQVLRAPRRAFVLVGVLACAVSALAATTGHRSASRHVVTPAVHAGGGPQYQALGAPDLKAQAVRFGCQTRLPSSFPASSCYGPQQIWKAYGFDQVFATGNYGAGASITIIDAYGDPLVQQGVDEMAAAFGIPSTQVNVIYPDGPAPVDVGWAVETDLDVQWAHAVAPAATINLVVAKSNFDDDILSATKYVADHHIGDVISQSFGENESCVDPALAAQQTAIFKRMAAQGQTLIASAGDDGAAQLACDGSKLVKAASSPAVDPNVTAVGGTSLVAQPATRDAALHTLTEGGAYVGETVWNEYALFGDRTSTGGGASVLYKQPAYQTLIDGNNKNDGMRWIPDVAYNAAIQGGVIVGIPLLGANAFFRVGGTSAGSPQWAGLVGLAVSAAGHGLGNINPKLYALGAGKSADTYYNDTIKGDNGVPRDFTGTHFQIVGYPGNAHWDASTGWGTPKAAALVSALGH